MAAANGIITTIVGTGAEGLSGEGGPATNAGIDGPENVALDRVGNLYFSDTNNNRPPSGCSHQYER